MEDNKLLYNNVENIIKELKTQSKCVKGFKKFDGITIECEVETPDKRQNAINEMQALTKKLNIIPVATEARKDSDVLFGVQFPELKPIYSEDESKKMYYDTFNFLFNNIKMKDPKALTKTVLLDNIDRFTRHAIMTYCKSNINNYKENVDKYINDTKYVAKINNWYLEYVNQYISNK